MNHSIKILSSLTKKIVNLGSMPLTKIINLILNFERRNAFEKHSLMDESVKILANATIDNLAKNSNLISIDKNSVIRGQLLVFPHGGKIQIGNDCYVGEGTCIWSSDSIKIGDRVFISHNVNVHDTNSHSIDPVLRYQHFIAIMSSGHPTVNNFDIESKPVVIEDDVWIGFNSTVLKGVKIGKGSIIAACSVVTKDIPERVIVAGNPSKIVKKL